MISLNKELDNITPLSDLFFHSCFYSVFLPVVNYYEGNMFWFLVSIVAPYQCYSENGRCSVYMDYIQVELIPDLLNKQGLTMCSQKRDDDITDTISKSIEEDTPVIIRIDTYYWPGHKDYLKDHNKHYILICGFHSQQSEFTVMDQEVSDGINYGFRRVSMSTLIQSYYGGFDFFLEDSLDTVFVVKRTGNVSKVSHNTIIETYNCNLALYSEQFSNGHHVLEDFAERFVVLLEAQAIDNYDDVITGFNDISNFKSAEVYINRILYGELSAQCIESKNIHEKWTIIRSLIARYMYSGRVNNPRKVLEYIQEIVVSEKCLLMKAY
ncbi:BtrH N-terminal domain-containing protein [Paenibacillus sp. EKM211P]|uniref:BtrH N-terminal domain-containing protein n=1 Tax=Paenibacillus sp. EKM211P TaxID=1683679 RepID=UPI0013E97ED5|nr:BtrH N-terminal domain-containing protein [Paenibacillus sp. EKM211P]KAF6582675.1 C39 family peptidase [Paenibacillus sp. EKM211P]